MAESQKGTSSSVDHKDKRSFLDGDIGNEFLGSWKSLSVIEDDTMDFSFDSISSGKKKTFNFEKLDMDFNLDGDFDKLSSFKVDKPDLDFSCLPKKAAKPKERSEGEASSRHCQGKQDSFSFSFDFNELDSFNFDSTLLKGEKTSVENLEHKGVPSDGSECQGSKINVTGGVDAFDDNQTGKLLASKVNLAPVADALHDGQTEKLPALDNAVTSMAETAVGVVRTGNFFDDNLPSKSGTSGNLVESHGARTSPEKIITTPAEETDQQSHFLEKTMHIEPYSQRTTEIAAVQSLAGNDPTQHTVSGVQTKVGHIGTKADAEIVAEDNVDDRIIAGVGSKHGNSQWNRSALPDFTGSETSRRESETTGGSTENVMETQPAVDDLDLEATSTAGLPQTIHYCKANKDIQMSTSKLFVPQGSESVVDKVTPMKEKESGVIRSKFFMRYGKTEPLLHLRSSKGVELSSFGSEKTTAMHFNRPANGNREDFNANDVQIGQNLKADSKSLSRELTNGETACLESKNAVKNVCNISCEVNPSSPTDKPTKPSSQASVSSQLVVSSMGSIQNSKIISVEGLKAGKRGDLSCLKISSKNFGNPASPTDKTTKSNTQTGLNSTLVLSRMGLIQNSKIISVEGLKAGKRTPDLSSLKISRTMGASKDQSNATLQREISFLRNLEKDMEVQGNTGPMIVHPIANAERKMPVITSLKRKTFEASNADPMPLKPLKRLSQSPSESRKFKEPMESVVEEQVCNHDNQAESTMKNILCGHRTSGLEITQEVNVKELDLPLAVENDGYVEKAEAYAKELEDICYMLKKKYEEAKEILVRAIVNNNNLLMLNHPVFDEKICMVQKFAAQLMSN